jgi:6-phosphogluconolactonase
LEPSVKIFETPLALATRAAEEFYRIVNKYVSQQKNIYIALSGGNTPKLLFKTLAENYKEKINWEFINFYWVDERCVPSNDIESNYGMAKRYLLDKIKISGSNIHRIKGEDEPVNEALRYSKEVAVTVPMERMLPQFDLILLGLGSDGHTASIFPNQMQLLESEKNYETAVQPETKQERITLTGKVINNAKQVYFLVSGIDKAVVVSQILQGDGYAYPAANIKPTNGEPSWFIDKDAASLLK